MTLVLEKGPRPARKRISIHHPIPTRHHGDGPGTATENQPVNTQMTHQLNGPGAVAGAPRGGRQAICAYPWSIGAANGPANAMFAHAKVTTDTSKLRSWRLRKSPH